jgi:2-hydroxychromene-2-carboxylate isomerase
VEAWARATIKAYFDYKQPAQYLNEEEFLRMVKDLGGKDNREY